MHRNAARPGDPGFFDPAEEARLHDEAHGYDDVHLLADSGGSASGALMSRDELDIGIVRVSDVSAERVEWLWPGRLAAGKLTVLDGDPSLGKSTLTLDWAACVTTGRAWPDQPNERPPGNVVLLSAEDGVADTIRPRLEAAGADLERVVVFDSVPDFDDAGNRVENRSPSIPGDLVALEELVRREGATLVVIDVLAAFLSSRVDSHRDQDVRRALMPLARLAERTGACVVVLRHLSKSVGANPLYRGGGSIGIIGAARAAMLVALDPEDEGRRVLAMTKSNLAALPSALAFRVVTDDDHACGRISWEGATAHKAADLLGLPGPRDDDRDDAAAVLTDLLGDGPVWVKECLDQMAAAGFSKDQAKRAKVKIGAGSEKHGAPGDSVSGWKWALHEGAKPPRE